VPQLGERDVRVSVSHCGVCFTDIHAIDDFYGITTFPFVPGHEVVGYVEALGREVAGLAEGDRVGIGCQGRSCERCEWCAQGEEQLCQDIAENGDGGDVHVRSVGRMIGSRAAVRDSSPQRAASARQPVGFTERRHWS